MSSDSDFEDNSTKGKTKRVCPKSKAGNEVDTAPSTKSREIMKDYIMPWVVEHWDDPAGPFPSMEFQVDFPTQFNMRPYSVRFIN